jgi:fatty acid desaturase
MQAWNRLDVLKDLNYKTIFQRFSFILAFVLLILFKLLSYCWGLVPWVPRVTGYDPKFWIQLVPFGDKRLGKCTPRTGYDPTTLG